MSKNTTLTFPENFSMSDVETQEFPVAGSKTATITKALRVTTVKDDDGKESEVEKWVQVVRPTQYELDCFGLIPGFTYQHDGIGHCNVFDGENEEPVVSKNYGAIRYSLPLLAKLSGVILPAKPTATRTSAKDTERIERMKALGLSDADIASVMGA